MTKTSVSIIIPTFNEQMHIGTCIKSLQRQTYHNIEIIVVDDGSTDDTMAIVQNLKHVSLLSQDHQGPGKARNQGAFQSKGDILVFVDADMTFDKDFIKYLVRPIKLKKTIGTFSKLEFVANDKNPWAQAWSTLRGFKNGRMHPPNYPNKQPVFRAILKSRFLKAGGFDDRRGYDDDWSLSQKLGVLATHAPKAIFYHHNPQSPSEIFLQSRWMAKRRYKFGVLGKIVAVFRTSPIVSAPAAIYLFARQKNPFIFSAKIIFDFGLFTGALESFFTKKISR